MKHKPNILLVGDQLSNSLKNLTDFTFFRCSSGQEALELFIESDFQLMLSQYQLPDQNAISLSSKVQSFLELYPSSNKKDTKLLVITNTPEEENSCKKNNLLYYPSRMELQPLLLKLIPQDQGDPEVVELLPINFKELFDRVDNNREFIKQVFEKFLEVYIERIDELRVLNEKNDFLKTKDTAHKLKGVLANFSMQKARQTIIKIEKSALEQEKQRTDELIDLLQEQIEEAIQYFHANQELFK